MDSSTIIPLPKVIPANERCDNESYTLLWIVKKGEYMQLLEKLYIRLQDYDRDKLEEVGDSLLKLVMQQSLSADDVLLTIIAIHLTSSIVAQ
ncbi:unnamed protein product [Rotaria sp. Silwood2]|nr:unnamed protein product [Rotaria sp. Silwood2]CAF4158767.1 unnamed protein product [Rotaria sp. Silwood2]